MKHRALTTPWGAATITPLLVELARETADQAVKAGLTDERVVASWCVHGTLSAVINLSCAQHHHDCHQQHHLRREHVAHGRSGACAECRQLTGCGDSI